MYFSFTFSNFIHFSTIAKRLYRCLQNPELTYWNHEIQISKYFTNVLNNNNIPKI